MKPSPDFEIVPYNPSLAEQIVKVWIKSKREALGDYVEPHDEKGFLEFLTTKLSKTHTVKVVLHKESKQVLGFIAFKGEDLSQIYLEKAGQGRGLGTTLLNFAKEASPGRLVCYTFQRNEGAKKFYEKNGFKAIGYGTANEENLPDILYEWKRDLL